MEQPAFDIKNDNLANLPSDCKLLIEVSAQAFNYILYKRNPDQLYVLRQYRIYTTADKSTREVLEEIISGDTILQKYSRQAIVVYNFPDANILPSEIFNTELKGPVTRLVYGDSDNAYIFDEEVSGWNMSNVYSISKDLHSLCKDKFGGSQYWHLYTMILLWSGEKDISAGASAKVVFYNDKFIVALFANGKLHLLQTFSYHTPEDVAYYLLLICRQFSIEQREIELNISGLIDAQSALYTELLKYFSEVNYEGIPPSYATGGLLEEYPAHYFSPLLKMSLCVS